MEKRKLIGVKGKEQKGFVYAPYIHHSTVVFPELKFAGYDENGQPFFRKVSDLSSSYLYLCEKYAMHQ